MARAEIEKINEINCSEEENNVDRIECEIGSTRRQASETIRNLKTEARKEGQKMKAKAKATWTQTEDKVKSRVNDVQSFGRQTLNHTNKTGLYAGLALMAAGFVTALIAVLYGRAEHEIGSDPRAASEAATESLQQIKREAEVDHTDKVIFRPAEFQEESTGLVAGGSHESTK